LVHVLLQPPLLLAHSFTSAHTPPERAYPGAHEQAPCAVAPLVLVPAGQDGQEVVAVPSL
jgi:hypothetical protein